MRIDLFDRFIIAALLGSFLYSCSAKAAETLLPRCEQALSSCDQAVERLKSQVVILTDDNKRWKKEAMRGSEAKFPLLPVIGVGMLAGAMAGASANSQSGLALGGVVGGAVGLTTWIFVEVVK